ncbi:MAG: hypothetical protein ACTSRA_09950, partial [Promethearchaeota archaeon]
EIDRYCTPEKQAKMLRLFILYYSKALELLSHGAPLFRLKEMNSVTNIARIRKDIPNEDYKKINNILEKMIEEFNDIGREII